MSPNQVGPDDMAEKAYAADPGMPHPAHNPGAMERPVRPPMPRPDVANTTYSDIQSQQVIAPQAGPSNLEIQMANLARQNQALQAQLNQQAQQNMALQAEMKSIAPLHQESMEVRLKREQIEAAEINNAQIRGQHSRIEAMRDELIALEEQFAGLVYIPIEVLRRELWEMTEGRKVSDESGTQPAAGTAAGDDAEGGHGAAAEGHGMADVHGGQDPANENGAGGPDDSEGLGRGGSRGLRGDRQAGDRGDEVADAREAAEGVGE